MPVHTVVKGLDIPISGVPEQVISDARPVTRVAILTRDFAGLKSRVVVEPGQSVLLGQPVLTHRAHDAIQFVSPGSGRVEAVYRGAKRKLLSVVIALDSGSGANNDEHVRFESFSATAGHANDAARALLLESGLWTAFRTRPFSEIPAPDAMPHSIFVTAMDTNPLAPDMDVVLRGRESDLARGLEVISHLTEGAVFFCRRRGSALGGTSSAMPKVSIEEFAGPHPSGTVGYHIHTLDPVNRGKTVWHIGVQDVVRIGHVFATGRLDVSTVIALGGPQVQKPRLLRTRLGACVPELVAAELSDAATAVGANGASVSRVISGSVLTGERIDSPEEGFLGRFHQQVSVLEEGGTREFLGWLAPGANAFSVFPAFLSSLLPRRRLNLDTSLRGSRRAMVPIGAYEKVMPMDIMPTHLLRALTVGDLGWAEELGALELDEEDLALCSFVCPGKYEHGAALRRALTAIAAEQ